MKPTFLTWQPRIFIGLRKKWGLRFPNVQFTSSNSMQNQLVPVEKLIQNFMNYDKLYVLKLLYLRLRFMM